MKKSFNLGSILINLSKNIAVYLIATIILLTMTSNTCYGQLPEILVEGGSPLLEIIDGDNTPDTADDTDFGAIANGTSDTHTFSITNTDIGDLTIDANGIIINTTTAGVYTLGTVSETLPHTLAQNETMTFEVIFSPNASSTSFSGSVQIENNDADEDPYTFDIQGFGDYTWVELSISPELGTTTCFCDGNQSLIVTDNFFDSSLSLNGVDNTGAFTLSVTQPMRLENMLANGANNGDNWTVTAVGGSWTSFGPESSTTGEDLSLALIDENNLNGGVSNSAVEFLFTKLDATGGGLRLFYALEACPASSATPEIDVQGNSTSITNGDATPDVADNTDFGNVDMSTNKSITYTIENSGVSELSLNGSPIVEVSGTHASEFVVISQATSPVTSNGGTTTFTIEFTPGALGLRTAIVSINNNDCDEDPYTFDIQGSGINEAAALNFDGSNWIEVSPNPIPTVTNLTFEAWCKPSAMDDWGRIIGSPSNLRNLQAKTNTENKFSFYPVANGAFVPAVAPNPWVDGQWYHVAGVLDDTSVKLYIDGELVATTMITDPLDNDMSTLYIGRSHVVSEELTGELDEVRIWSVARTCEEINHYKDCELAGTETGLEAYYQFNQGIASGSNTGETTLNDETANNNDGTLIDFTLTGSTSNWIAPGGVTSGNTCMGTPMFPEMAIEGGSTPTEIANGDTTPDTADYTDFGTNTINSNTDHTFIIKNTGTDVLNLTGNPIIEISGDSDFTILTQPSSSMIASGGSDLTFVVRYTPTTEATHVASISIANDDCDENPYTFNIQGTGVEVASALDFTGSNDYVDLGTDPFEFVGNFTIETWLNHNSSDGRIMDKGVSGGEGPVLDLHNGIRFISADGGAGQYIITAPVIVPSNVWTHVALSIDVTNLIAIYYVDGVVVHTAAISGDVSPNPTLNMTLGAHLNGSSNFNGLLDEFRVWSDVRTCAEIASNKDCELTGTEDNLALYYNFNQGIDSGNNPTETILNDNLGNGNDGTLINFALIGSSSNWISPGGVANGNTCTGSSLFPEIVIEGGSTPTEIVNGDSSPDTTDDTDFGTQTTNTNSDHTFTIKNTGTETLNLFGNPIVAISGDSEFTILTQPSSNMIASGGSDLTFVVRYTPTIEATHNATISIANDDCDEDPYTFDIQGTGQVPQPAKALHFDGVDDAVVSENDVTLFGSQPTTVEFWVYNESGSGHLGAIGIANEKYFFYPNFGGTSQFVDVGGGWYNMGELVPSDTWTHVAVTYDGVGTMKGYINGAPAATPSQSKVWTSASGPVYLGTRGSNGPYWQGGMDEVRIWEEERTAAEIAANYDEELATMPACMPIYWKLNQGVEFTPNPTDTVAIDTSFTLRNNGVLNDFALTGATSNWVTGAGITEQASTPAPYGEMNITGNGVSIINNDDTPTENDDTDFGDVNLGQNDTHTFTIENLGTGDLDLSGIPIVQLSGPHANNFSITTQPTAPVASNGSTTFVVQFMPSALGLRTATISIANSDCDEDPYTFDIQGTGAGVAEITLQGNGITIANGDNTPSAADDTDFGDICNGESTSKTFTIFNTGALDLNISNITASNSNYTIVNTPSVVGASNFKSFTVDFQGSIDGSQTATITINSDDPDDNPFIFDVTADVNTNPTAGLTADMTTVCAGEEVTFTATGGTMYEFFINGNSQGAASATATFASTTLVNDDVVSVTTTDANGCTDTHAGITITVNPNPTAGLTANMTTICAGEEVTFTATGGTMYEFFINGNSQGASSATATFASTTLVNNDVVSVTTTDANGCTDTHAGIAINVNENPVYTSVTVNCTGGTLDDVVVNATINIGTLEYSVDGGMYQASNTFTGLSQGNHTFDIRESTTLCSVSSGIQMISCACPTITMNTISADQSICAGESTTIIDGETAAISPVTAFDYQWQSSPTGANNFTNIGSATNEDYDAGSPSASTDYRRLVMVSGCPDDISNIITITVNPNPTAGLTADMTTICASEEITFTATGGTMYEFFINGNSQGAASATTTFASTTLVNNDVVSVTTTDANGCIDTHAGITITVNPNPTAGLTADMTTICAGEEVTFTATGGTMYEFFVNGNSQGAASATATFASTTLVNNDVVSVTTTDANGCTDTHAGITIIVNENPVYTSVTVNCTGGTLDDVVVNATISTGTLEYSVDGGMYQASNTFTGLSQGNHTFDIRESTTFCSVSSGIQMISCACPSVTMNTISADQSICAGESTTIIDGETAATSPVTTFDYQWQSSPAGANNFTNIGSATNEDYNAGSPLASTDYRRLVMVSGCPDDISNIITITVNPNPTAGLSADMTTVCAGEEVTFTATGGTMYEFFVNGNSQGAASATATFASTTLVNNDVVSVTTTDANGCTDTHAGIAITVNPNPTAGLTADMTTICTGEEVTFTATGGTMYEFFVNGNSQGAASATATFASTTLVNNDVVSVTVTDANGCTDTHAGITITVNENPVYTSVTVNCTGGTLDDVVVNATISIGTLEYSVDGGMYQASNTFTGLSQGNHTFDIRESTTLCSVSSGIQMISCACPTITMNTISSDQSICAGESTTIIDGETAATSPVTAFNYQWQSSPAGANNFTNIGSATNEDYDAGSPSASTDYRRLVMVSGCPDDISNIITITVNPNPTAGLTADMMTICAGEEVTFTATGGTMYEFFVNGNSQGAASTTATFASTALVNNDVVSVTTTDANGCTDTHAGITITVNPNPTAGLTANMTTICAGEEVTITATGGTMYEFFINGNSQGAASATATFASTTLVNNDVVSVTVTDANGCTDTHAGITITVNENPVYTSVTVNCTGGTLDDVVVNATISIGTLEYSVDGGMYQASNTFTGLSQGNHTFDIRESTTLCSVNSGIQMISCACPTITMNTISSDQSICAGESTTIIDGETAATSPVTAFNYQWQSSPAGANNFTNIGSATNEDYDAGSPLASTDYRRLVMVSGCPDDISNIITITVNPNPTAGITADMTTICAGEEVTFTATGGTMYEFFVNGNGQGAASATATFASTALVNNDVVSVTVTDANGCTDTHAGITITVNPNPTAGLTADMTTVCAGEEVTFTATGGSMYEFFVNGNSQGAASATATFASTTLVNNDVVSVTSTDVNGCTDTHAGIMITVNPLPTAMVNSNSSELDCATTMITLDGLSSTGQGMLSYLWSTGSTDPSITIAAPGQYKITVTDANFCIAVDSIMITQDVIVPTAVINSGGITEISCLQTSITLEANGSSGQGILSYAWSTGESTSGIEVTSAGTYTVTVTDSDNSCTAEESITITGNTTAPIAIINSGGINTLTCAQPNITLNAGGSTGQGTLAYLWSTGETTASINVSTDNTYSVTITDSANSCTDDSNIIITQDLDVPTADINSNGIIELTCDQTMISLDASGSSGMGMISYLWSTGETASTISIAASDTYGLTITDGSNGCTAEASIVITEDVDSPDAMAIPDFSELTCTITNINIDGSGSTGQGNISYLWSTGSTMSTISINTADSYTLTITDADNGCTDEVTVVITEDLLEPVADISSSTTELTCLITNIILDGNASTGQGNLGYLWSTGETTSAINITSADTYALTITDSNNGCTNETTTVITEDMDVPTASIISPLTELTCNTTFIELNGSGSTGQGTISYLWSTGETTASINVSAPNTYSLTITDSANGCTAVTNQVITQDIVKPVAVIESSDPIFTCAINMISLDATMSSGQGTITYLWSTGETTSSINVTQVNAYTVTITDAANGCTDEETISLTMDNSSPTIAVVPSDTELNCDITTLTLDASSSVGQGAISYLWNTGETTATIDIAAPGVYGLTITDAQNGCTNSTSTSVSQDVTSPNANISSATNVLTCTTTSITLDGGTSSGQGTITYLWSTGETAASIDVNSADTYSLTITDSDNGCTDVATRIITENGDLPTAIINTNSTELTCTLISITLDGSTSSGQGMISYLWSTGETTSTISVNAVGTYTLTITDDVNGCTQSEDVVITENITLPIISVSPSAMELTCDITTITLDANPSITQGNASYLWSTGEITSTIDVTAPDIYSLTLTDGANGCTNQINVTISEDINDPIAAISSSTMELNCDISVITLDGSTSTAQGNIGYQWSTGETTATIDINAIGGYSLTITDLDNGCTDETSINITEDTLEPTVEIQPNESEFNCEINTINLDASGSQGQGVLNYLWSTGETSANIDVLSPDTYKVTITDLDNGCIAEDSIIIGQDIMSPIATISSAGITEITCAQEMITLDASGSSGQGMITFVWSTGSIEATTEISAAGTYSVTITDEVNGCTAINSIGITENLTTPIADIQASESELTCTILTSTLDATGSTGQGTLSYAWSTGESTPTITVNAANNYTVTVTDNENGCIDENTISITQDIMDFTALVVPSSTEFTCDITTVDIDASGSVGQGTLTFLWSTGETSSIITVTNPSTYTVTITDSNNGCQIIQGTTLTEDILEPTIMSTLSEDELTCDVTSITIDASTSIGQGIISYLWSTGETTSSIEVTSSGDYDLTITDSDNGCSENTTINVGQNVDVPIVSISSTANEITCTTTDISLDASGSTSSAALTYLWNTGEITDVIIVTIADTYTVTVTDEISLCTSEETITISENTIEPSANISQSTPELTCDNLFIELDASVSIGQGTLTYEWNTGEVSETIFVTVADVYSVTITDSANGCTSEATLTITEDIINPVANISSASLILTCADDVLILDGSGSTGQGNISYAWSTGETSPTIEVNVVGTYELTITDDDNGCTDITTRTVTDNIVAPTAAITSGGVTELTCAQPSITLNGTSSSGQGVLTYLWGTGETSPTIEVDMTGTYDLTITDNINGCTDVTSISITQNDDLPVADIVASGTELTCDVDFIVLDGAGSTAQGTISYSWSTGEISEFVTIMDAGTYDLTITDNVNGCTNTTMIVVTENKIEPQGSLVASAQEITCTTLSIDLDVSGYTGQGNLSYLWSTGETTATISISTAALYDVTITDDANGCFSTESLAITENTSLPSASINAPITELTCDIPSITLDGSVSSGQGNLTYEWSTGEVTENIVVEAQGTYSLTITDDSNGCTQETSINITQDENVPVLNLTSSATVLTCLIEDITLDASTSTGQGIITYIWSTGSTEASINVTEAGTYTVTITDNANGCTEEQSQEIMENNISPAALIESPSSSLNCDNESLVLNGANSSSQGTITYLWSTTETTASIIIEGIGTYGLTITDAANGCTAETSIVIDENLTKPTANLVASALELTCELISINIDASSSIGQGSLAYEWSTGESSSSIDIVSAGTYSVTVSDMINGCSDESEIIITEDVEGLELSLIASDSELNCDITSILLDASGSTGQGTLSYLWSTGETTTTISVTEPNTYSVTITDAQNGCEIIGMEVINQDINEPTITLTYPETICLNESPIDINPLPGGGLLTGIGIIGTSFDPSVAGVGQFSLQYSYTGLNGCSKDSTFMIEVLGVPLPNISGEVEYCLGSDLMLMEDSGTGNNWMWAGPNGFLATTASITINDLQPNQVGQYTVEITNAEGCVATTQVDVSLGLSPTLTFVGIQEVCEGSDITISEIAGEAVSWTWTGPNGFNEAGDQISFTYTQGNFAGKYYLEIANADGCIRTDSFDLKVNALPIIDLLSNGPLCEGESLELMDISGLGTTFDWTGPDGFVSSESNPIISNVGSINSGKYYLLLEDDNGCNASDSIEIVVNRTPKIDVSSSSPICDGEDLEFSENGGDASQWVWTSPSGLIFNGQDVIINNNDVELGNYNLEVIDDNGCTASLDTLVTSASGTDIETNFLIGSLACVGDSIRFIDYSVIDSSTQADFFWDFGNGDTSTERDPFYMYSASGIYDVNLEITNGECPNISIDKTIEIIDCRQAEDVFIDVNAYPTITTGSFAVELKSEQDLDMTVEVISADGALLYTRYLKDALEQMNLEIDLPNAGIYTLIVRHQYGTESRRIFVVR